MQIYQAYNYQVWKLKALILIASELKFYIQYSCEIRHKDDDQQVWRESQLLILQH